MFLKFDDNSALPLEFHVTSKPHTEEGADTGMMLVRVALVDLDGFELEGKHLATSYVGLYSEESDVATIGQEIASALVYDIRARYLEIETLEAGAKALPVTKDISVNVDSLRLVRAGVAPVGGDQ